MKKRTVGFVIEHREKGWRMSVNVMNATPSEAKVLMLKHYYPDNIIRCHAEGVYYRTPDLVIE